MAMYCANCGVEQTGNEKFCAKCGQPIVTTAIEKETKTSKLAKKNFGVFGAFTISEEELRLQIENYNTLPFFKSSRGIAVITMVVLLLIGISLGVVFRAL